MGCCQSNEVKKRDMTPIPNSDYKQTDADQPVTAKVTAHLNSILGAYTTCFFPVGKHDEVSHAVADMLLHNYLDSIIPEDRTGLSMNEKAEMVRRCISAEIPGGQDAPSAVYFDLALRDVAGMRPAHPSDPRVFTIVEERVKLVLFMLKQWDTQGFAFDVPFEQITDLLKSLNFQSDNTLELQKRIDAEKDKKVRFVDLFEFVDALQAQSVWKIVRAKDDKEATEPFKQDEALTFAPTRDEMNTKLDPMKVRKLGFDLTVISKIPVPTLRQASLVLNSKGANPWFIASKYHKLHQSMNQPMTHYYIDSSHNTFLVGNQTTSDSSVDQYITALKEGCRCVELDCYDGDDNEPMVTHGMTMCGKILFKDVIIAINLNAFSTSSPYPVILSLELHCGDECLDKMADYMIKIFGSKLLTKANQPKEMGFPDFTPDGLKNKILVKAGYCYPNKEEEKKEEGGMFGSLVNMAKEGVTAIAEGVTGSKEGKSAKLSDLIWMPATKLPDPLTEKVPCNGVKSLGEGKVENYAKVGTPEHKDFCQLTQRFFIRNYPAGTRVDSSNFDPIPCFSVGCQLVAMNYQTCDDAWNKSRSLFAANGNCGYVLKPECLRKEFPKPKPTPIPLKVTVMGANNIISPSALSIGAQNYYVEVHLDGATCDDSDETKEQNQKGLKTAAVSTNGLACVWNETAEFKLRIWELAFLTVSIKESGVVGDSVVAYASIPVPFLEKGIRSVPLVQPETRAEQFACTTLLLNVQFDAPKN